jgi:anti-anti-sigma factor
LLPDLAGRRRPELGLSGTVKTGPPYKSCRSLGRRHSRIGSGLMQLTAYHELHDDAVVVRCEGEVDLAVADEFRSHLDAGLDAASANRPLIIDLQAVAFFASAGLGAVLKCHDERASSGIAVSMVTTSPIVIHTSNKKARTVLRRNPQEQLRLGNGLVTSLCHLAH